MYHLNLSAESSLHIFANGPWIHREYVNNCGQLFRSVCLSALKFAKLWAQTLHLTGSFFVSPCYQHLMAPLNCCILNLKTALVKPQVTHSLADIAARRLNFFHVYLTY